MSTEAGTRARGEPRVTRMGLAAALATAAVAVVTVAAVAWRGSGPASGPAETVVVYTSVDQVQAQPIADRFEGATGITVRLVPDTEETKSTGLVSRLIAEKERPQADVFWSGDPVRAALLKARGVSAAYRSPRATGLPARFSDPEGHWTGFSARARVLLVNRDLVPAGQEPRSVLDLAGPRFHGRACLANPLFGTTSMHAAALFATLGAARARGFFDRFLAAGGRVLSSNGEVRRRVADGEFAVGLCDSDDANVARLDGKPVDVVYPDGEGDGMGALLIPSCAVLIAHAPHAEAGRRFIDFLLAPETEQALAAGEGAQIPLRPGVPVPAGLPAISGVKTMDVDYARLAPLLEELAHGYLKDWVERSQR